MKKRRLKFFFFFILLLKVVWLECMDICYVLGFMFLSLFGLLWIEVIQQVDWLVEVGDQFGGFVLIQCWFVGMVFGWLYW